MRHFFVPSNFYRRETTFKGKLFVCLLCNYADPCNLTLAMSTRKITTHLVMEHLTPCRAPRINKTSFCDVSSLVRHQSQDWKDAYEAFVRNKRVGVNYSRSSGHKEVASATPNDDDDDVVESVMHVVTPSADECCCKSRTLVVDDDSPRHSLQMIDEDTPVELHGDDDEDSILIQLRNGAKELIEDRRQRQEQLRKAGCGCNGNKRCGKHTSFIDTYQKYQKLMRDVLPKVSSSPLLIGHGLRKRSRQQCEDDEEEDFVIYPDSEDEDLVQRNDSHHRCKQHHDVVSSLPPIATVVEEAMRSPAALLNYTPTINERDEEMLPKSNNVV